MWLLCCGTDDQYIYNRNQELLNLNELLFLKLFTVINIIFNKTAAWRTILERS